MPGAAAAATARDLSGWESEFCSSANWIISSAEAVENGVSEPPPQALSAAKAAMAVNRCVVVKTFFTFERLGWMFFMTVV
jgi:hypothetical protein